MSRTWKPQRTYCLRCFATLGAGETLCDACGFATTPSMRRQFWSLAPGMLRTQRFVRMVCAITTIALVAVLAFAGGHGGTGAGYLIGLPVIAYAAMHMTLEKLTCHAPNFRPAVFWSTSCFLAALAAVLVAFFEWSLGMSTRVFLCACGAALLLAGLMVFPLTRRLDAWKRRMMSEVPG